MRRSIFTLRVVLLLVTGLIFSGCGDITGESPRIGSEAQTAEPATTVTAPAHATPPPTPQTRWSEVADSVFGTTESEQPQTPPPAANTTSPSVVANLIPAITVPDTPSAPDPGFADASSLFLRRAQNASVFWRTWSPEAFAEAESRGVPVVLLIGSSWSYETQVMDQQVFTDEEVANVLNGNFVTIRVDSDERPDIWARYRLAFEIINKQMARPPLIAFALPDGRPFDVVGAVPARGTGDEAGLMELLEQVNDLVSTRRAEVTEQAGSVESVLAQLLTAPRAGSGELTEEILNTMAGELAAASMGEESEALRAGRVASFLMHHHLHTKSDRSREAGSELLLSRFRSGQRDHVMGGYFFRIPGTGDIQFGKLLTVQGEMISANARAYAVTNKGLHQEGVTEVLRFCRDWLEAADGGFYACQAPGVEGELSGDYYTYTREEIEEVAGDPEDATVFAEYLNAKPGEKTNLHVTGRLQQAADAAGVSYQEANSALNTVRMKLRNERMGAEKVPLVDKSVLAGWNGDMIRAYLEAAELANDENAREFALKSADMIIESMVSERDGVARVLYKGRATGFGFLEDNVKVAAALVKCYEVTNQQEYLDSARSLMEFVEARFLDQESGLYQDVVSNGSEAQKQGLLKLKRLPLEDDISRSSNAVAAIVWYQLHRATDEASFKERAARMVNAALQRRPFTTEATATWGEAGLLVQYGAPEF